MSLQLRGLVPLLQVYDMPTSVRFYRDALGFEIVSTSPRLGDDHFHWVSLRLSDAELMLNDIYESNDERPPELDRVRNTAHGDTGRFARINTDRKTKQIIRVHPVSIRGFKMRFFRILPGGKLVSSV